MTKQIIIRLISEMLVNKFPLASLKSIRSLLNQGMLLDVFSDGLDKAIETKSVQDWQESQNG